MTKRLEGKKALITGSSKGIGKGVASVFLDEGASVFLSARGAADLERTAQELSAKGEVEFFAADLAVPGEAEELAARAVAAFPGLNVLVNNASIVGQRVTLDAYDVATWDEVLRVNTSSLFYLTRPLIPHLTEQAGASIINVSSTVGRIGKPRWGAYAVSKFGVEGLTQVLAAELGPAGVRVNAVNPGATRTGMRAAAYPDEDPLTLPTPEDVAEVFVHLASDASGDTNGATLEARDYFEMSQSSGETKE